jgi:ABC-type iron transport system FetAB permease component
MQRQPISWERLIFMLAITFTVLIGCAYVIAINFQVPIPWLAILLVSIVGTALSHVARQRRNQRDSNE